MNAAAMHQEGPAESDSNRRASAPSSLMDPSSSLTGAATVTPPLPSASSPSPEDRGPTTTAAAPQPPVVLSVAKEEDEGDVWGAGGDDSEDEKLCETLLYIGNLPGPIEAHELSVARQLQSALRSHIGNHRFEMTIHMCVPASTDGRRWARLALYSDSDVRTVLSLHDTFLCNRFIAVRQAPDFQIVGIGHNPPLSMVDCHVCKNCGDFMHQRDYGMNGYAPNVCKECGGARRVLKNIVGYPDQFYAFTTNDMVDHFRKRISHPRHIHRRAFEQDCRYGHRCQRAVQGTCWYAHDPFEAHVGDVIRRYIGTSQRPVRSSRACDPNAAVFKPARRSAPEAPPRADTSLSLLKQLATTPSMHGPAPPPQKKPQDVVSNLLASCRLLCQQNLQRDLNSKTLMDLAEETAQTYQALRDELASRHLNKNINPATRDAEEPSGAANLPEPLRTAVSKTAPVDKDVLHKSAAPSPAGIRPLAY